MATSHKTKPYTVRLPEDLLPKLDDRASALGVPTSDLVRSWILAKLDEPHSPTPSVPHELRELAGIIIAAHLDAEGDAS